jgi:YrbI family 3-deoxy-D-manno-octulosonate 8-phosphate phosphatase
MLPKLVITDIDGVWTDGGMYYDQQGNEWKKFNTSDSAGVLFLRLLNIPLVIMTGEDTAIVQRRAEKLRIENVYQGVRDKLTVAQNLCAEMNIDLQDVAFIGDDLGDMPLLRKVGYSACPSNSPDYVKSITHFTTNKAGGDGAFREFVEHILKSNHRLDEILEQHERSLYCS